MKSESFTARRKRGIRTETLTAAEVARLEDLRVGQRWSYREMAEQMSEHLKVRMPEPTLTKALRELRGLPTTILPIRRFLAEYRIEATT